jgi:hypothetical protein
MGSDVPKRGTKKSVPQTLDPASFEGRFKGRGWKCSNPLFFFAKIVHPSLEHRRRRTFPVAKTRA